MDKNLVDAICRDLTEYFNQADSSDVSRNQTLAKEIIIRYGSTLLIESFALALIVDDLREAPTALALTHALNRSLVRFYHVMDFVSARETIEAKNVLGTMVPSRSDEDICALAALMLASPRYADAVFLKTLQEKFDLTEGTSCRMALAFALFQCGDDRQLKGFIRDGYLPDYEQEFSMVGQQYTKEKLNGYIAFKFMPMVLKIVIEDCGTEGKGFDVLYNLRSSSPSLVWKRKQYND